MSAQSIYQAHCYTYTFSNLYIIWCTKNATLRPLLYRKKSLVKIFYEIIIIGPEILDEICKIRYEILAKITTKDLLQHHVGDINTHLYAHILAETNEHFSPMFAPNWNLFIWYSKKFTYNLIKKYAASYIYNLCTRFYIRRTLLSS